MACHHMHANDTLVYCSCHPAAVKDDLGARGGRGGSAMTPLERATVVSYRLSKVTPRKNFISRKLSQIYLPFFDEDL